MHRTVSASLWILLAIGVSPTAAVERVVTIGDSWAHLVHDKGSLQLMLNTFHPGVTAANESFGGGTAANHAAWLSQITSKINAHPSADIVWLSSGGNDMLLGSAGGGWHTGLGPSQENALYDTIGSNVQTVVNHILGLRSDIQVVIVSYDYLNVWETGDAGLLVAANLGLWNFLMNGEVNAAFRNMETRKQTIANNSRRVHHVWAYGLVNSTVGYSGSYGSLPGQGYYPPDLYPDYPTRPDYMGNDDPIHMNTSGYNLLALHAENHFFNTVFQSASLSLSPSTINFGNVRVGTSAGGSVTASNNGPNFTKVKNLTFPSASGEFSGSVQSFAPLFKDPTLGSDTAGKNYGYAPTNRGGDSQGLTVTSDSGNRSLTLVGTGVGPVVGLTPLSMSFGDVPEGETPSADVTIRNTTTDADLGNLTDLTIHSVQVTGPDAALFQVSGFSPGTVLGKNQTDDVTVTFHTVGASTGAKSAFLQISTDEGAAFGGSGTTYNVPLSGTVQAVRALTLDIVNEPWGSVTLDPPPDDPNNPSYVDGTPVALTAVPEEDREFSHWLIFDPAHPNDANYATEDANQSIQLVMDQDRHVSATFRCGSGAVMPLILLIGLIGVRFVMRSRTRP